VRRTARLGRTASRASSPSFYTLGAHSGIPTEVGHRSLVS
jgi:hypothetical protein